MRNCASKSVRGFTLLEVLITIGLFAIVAGLALSVGLHTHSGFTVKDDEDVAIATLQKARSQSMNGVCVGNGCIGAAAHGVHVGLRSLALFQGSTYDPADSTNEYTDTESNATTFSGGDIVFTPLSGKVDGTSTLLIFDNNTLAVTITIGPEGRLTWSK